MHDATSDSNFKLKSQSQFYASLRRKQVIGEKMKKAVAICSHLALYASSSMQGLCITMELRKISL